MIRRLVALGALALASCGSKEPSRDLVAECEAKGEAYFRSIESWPKLSDGRDAAEVAEERCARTPTAFDGLS